MKTDQFIRALAHDLPTHPATVKASLWRVLPGVTAIMLIGWLAVVGVRPDVLSAGLRPTIIKLAIGLLLTLVGVRGAMQLTRPEATASAPVRWLASIPVLTLAAVGAEWLTLGSQGWQMRLFGKGQLVCLIIIPLLALLPMIGLLSAMHRGASTEPQAAGAFAGIGAAGIAIVAYGLFCTENSAFYIGTWYILAAVIAALLGAIAGRLVLRW